MGTSARKENRWRRQTWAANDEIGQRQRELEAAHMARGPRPAVVLPAPNPRKRQVLRWMQNNAADYDCATQLAEAANAAFDLPQEWLDDETHWIWDCALAAMNEQEAQ